MNFAFFAIALDLLIVLTTHNARLIISNTRNSINRTYYSTYTVHTIMIIYCNTRSCHGFSSQVWSKDEEMKWRSTAGMEFMLRRKSVGYIWF